MSDQDPVTRNTAEINTFFMLSKSLTEVLDLTEVLNRIVEAARFLTNAEEGMILLPEGDELYLRAKVGIDAGSVRNFRVRTKNTLAGNAFRTGQPILIGASGPQKVKTEYFVNSLIYVPILGVDNKNKRDQFTARHCQMLVNLASFAAIALENARIHQESLDRSLELATLVTASEILNDSLSLSDTLTSICEQLVAILHVNYAEVLKWDQKINRLCTLASFNRSTWRFGQGPRLSLADHPSVKAAIDTNQSQWLERKDAIPSTELSHLMATGAREMLTLPVLSDHCPLGCFRFFYTIPPNTPPADNIIQQVLHTGLETLVDVLGREDWTLTQNTLQSINRMNKMTGADWSDLIIPTEDPNAFSVLVRIGDRVWLEPPSPYLDLIAYPDLTYALETLDLVHGNSDKDTMSGGAQAILDKTQNGVLLGIPLIRRGQAQGIVILATTSKNRTFSRREISIARAIVGQAATALENSTLVHDLEQSLNDLEAAQDRLVQTARLSAMGELATVVAHQINNPLTTIIADTDLMLLVESEGSPRYLTLQTIARAGRRAANVARRLLAIARPIDPTAKPDTVSVVDSLREVLPLLQPHIERRNIRVIVRFPSDPLPPVKVIKGQLDDVWINLLMNAYDALDGHENGEIGVETLYQPEDHQIVITIWDNGPGVPSHLYEQIFSPFFTTKPAGEGTGIGLHICREIVENTGGTIEVESKPDEITRFIVSLPTIDA